MKNHRELLNEHYNELYERKTRYQRAFLNGITMKQFDKFTKLKNKCGDNWFYEIDISKVTKKLRNIRNFEYWRECVHEMEAIGRRLEFELINGDAA